MKFNIDPVISSRIKKAWKALSPEQRNRIAPMLAKANQQAVTVTQTGQAPPPDPTVSHLALLAKSALTNDQDGVVSSLADVVITIGSGGQIWGTGKYEQLDPGWTESIAVWLEHLVVGKYAFNGTTAPTIPIPDDIQIAMAGDWGTGDWRTASNPAPSTRSEEHTSELQSLRHLVCRLLLGKKRTARARRCANARWLISRRAPMRRAERSARCSHGAACARCRRCSFFFNDAATTEIYTLSLHDALPIWRWPGGARGKPRRHCVGGRCRRARSEEHTSELQSLRHLVCRLLLEKTREDKIWLRIGALSRVGPDALEFAFEI